MTTSRLMYALDGRPPVLAESRGPGIPVFRGSFLPTILERIPVQIYLLLIDPPNAIDVLRIALFH